MNDFPENIQSYLTKFRSYLVVRRDRDPATADAYSHDTVNYIEFYRKRIDETLASFTITPETFLAFSDHLKQSKLSKSTVQRRLIGLEQFWKFLYKNHYTDHPPVSPDDLDIVIKPQRNPTPPLSPEQFSIVRKEAKNGLKGIY